MPSRDELLAHASDRLTRLDAEDAPRLPRRPPWEQTDDVLQNAALRLCRALSEVQPPTAADFFRWRRRRSAASCSTWPGAIPAPHRLGAHHASVAGAGRARTRRADPADTTYDPDRLAAWTDFHREVEALPPDEREAFDLLFYQGLAQAEAAACWTSRSARSSADGRRRGCGWSRRWAGRCPASEPCCDGEVSP